MVPVGESPSGKFCIYQGRHYGKKVVLKTLAPAFADDAVAQEQLRKEFSLGFEVDSPRVARALAWLNMPDTGLPAIEMEYCSGEDLRKLLDSGTTFSKEEIEAIVGGILEGLVEIHRAGIVHRDIKPSNIIFDRERLSLKIIDFGCADSVDSAVLKSAAGTARYTPPEKRAGTPVALPVDDLYAVGQLLLELATTADPGMSRRLRKFASKLLAGKFTTASEAAEAFSRLGSKPNGRIILSVVAITIICGVLIAFYLSKRQAGSDVSAVEHIAIDSNGKQAETEPVEATPADEKHFSHKIADRKDTESDATETTRVDKTVTVDVNESSTPVGGKESATIATLAEYALAAGPLMRRSQMGLTTETEEADLAVIQFADSIYRATMMYPFLGKTFDKDQQMKIASETAARYAEEVSRLAKVNGKIDTERQRALLAARILASLTTYHSPIQL